MRITVADAKLKRALVALVSRIDNPSQELNDIGDALASNIRANLGRGLQYDGAPMKPLASGTVNARFRGGKRYTSRGATTAKFYRHMTGKHVPLNDTGQHIYNRITHQVIGRDTVVVGMLDSAAAKIGRVHQFGATIRAKNARFLAIPVGDGIRLVKQVTIPRRPFLPLTGTGAVDLPAAWRSELLEIMKSSLSEALNSSR